MADKVGYRRPPKHTRWKKGQSGNPRGRPKGATSLLEAVLAELSESIQITEGGRVRRITKLQALIKALTNGAIKGDSRAASLVLSWSARAIEGGAGVEDESLTATQREIVEAYLERQVELRLAKRKKEDK